MREVNLSLYRAMWRTISTPSMRRARFQIPLDKLPPAVLLCATRQKPAQQNHSGLAALVRTAWREGAALEATDDVRRALDDGFTCLRELGELQVAPRIWTLC